MSDTKKIKLIAQRPVHEINADGMAVGRIATKAATLLRGKQKATFAAHIDDGDAVVIVNAARTSFTGRKLVQKDYRKHTMHPGGLKVTSMKKVFERDPADVFRRAVYGMLPKNKHREEYMKRLTIKN